MLCQVLVIARLWGVDQRLIAGAELNGSPLSGTRETPNEEPR
jgi:hypothetical protein